MLLHYHVEAETPKMHMNKNAAFNFIYEIAVKFIRLPWQCCVCGTMAVFVFMAHGVLLLKDMMNKVDH